jgi:hypothetical protein
VKTQVQVIDGRSIESGYITYSAIIGLQIHDPREQLPLFITKFGLDISVLRIPSQ